MLVYAEVLWDKTWLEHWPRGWTKCSVVIYRPIIPWNLNRPLQEPDSRGERNVHNIEPTRILASDTARSYTSPIFSKELGNAPSSSD